ncbi:dodecin family protein [uncultured Winogradskyella sp.]|uniref:dodecin family protein n=1 Tax=uncultured Winogradskyella sp. TaxID=395353 RepID=UPI00260A683C|nr:dodecin family protein [uncultured Winogradskyella sp.]
MSVLKVIEVLGNSTVSFDDAVKNVVKEASQSVKNIKSVYVKDMQATVKNNAVVQYRVTTKVCFGIMDTE